MDDIVGGRTKGFWHETKAFVSSSMPFLPCYFIDSILPLRIGDHGKWLASNGISFFEIDSKYRLRVSYSCQYGSVGLTANWRREGARPTAHPRAKPGRYRWCSRRPEWLSSEPDRRATHHSERAGPNVSAPPKGGPYLVDRECPRLQASRRSAGGSRGPMARRRLQRFPQP